MRKAARSIRSFSCQWRTSSKGAEKVVIVPDGVLYYLPFETLVAPEANGTNEPKLLNAPSYLLQAFAISYAPSASALAAVQATKISAGHRWSDGLRRSQSIPIQPAARGSSRRPRPFFTDRAFDLRQLPYTRAEVIGIGEFFTAGERRLFLGAEANEGRVKTEKLDGYRYLHFGPLTEMIDEENPARSGVILSWAGNEKEDGMLQVTEIMRLKLQADLVTLSACRTGLGKFVRGEGVLGLTRAFQFAGAP